MMAVVLLQLEKYFILSTENMFTGEKTAIFLLNNAKTDFQTKIALCTIDKRSIISWVMA